MIDPAVFNAKEYFKYLHRWIVFVYIPIKQNWLLEIKVELYIYGISVPIITSNWYVIFLYLKRNINYFYNYKFNCTKSINNAKERTYKD